MLIAVLIKSLIIKTCLPKTISMWLTNEFFFLKNIILPNSGLLGVSIYIDIIRSLYICRQTGGSCGSTFPSWWWWVWSGYPRWPSPRGRSTTSSRTRPTFTGWTPLTLRWERERERERCRFNKSHIRLNLDPNKWLLSLM